MTLGVLIFVGQVILLGTLAVGFEYGFSGIYARPSWGREFRTGNGMGIKRLPYLNGRGTFTSSCGVLHIFVGVGIDNFDIAAWEFSFKG